MVARLCVRAGRCARRGHCHRAGRTIVVARAARVARPPSARRRAQRRDAHGLVDHLEHPHAPRCARGTRGFHAVCGGGQLPGGVPQPVGGPVPAGCRRRCGTRGNSGVHGEQVREPLLAGRSAAVGVVPRWSRCCVGDLPGGIGVRQRPQFHHVGAGRCRRHVSRHRNPDLSPSAKQ